MVFLRIVLILIATFIAFYVGGAITHEIARDIGARGSDVEVLAFLGAGVSAVIALVLMVLVTKRMRKKPPSQQPRVPPHQMPVKRIGIFISYRRQDSADITGRIYDRLVQQFGRDAVFKDVDSIPLGIDFRAHLQAAVGQCNVLLAIIGNRWVGMESGRRRLDDARDHLRIEIETALQRNIPVIPILVQGASVPAEEDLPSSLQSLAYRNGLAIRTDPDFHTDMERLIKGIHAY